MGVGSCDRKIRKNPKPMMLQINPEMWVMTPKGEGLAFLVTDYGMDHNKIFTVMLQSGDILDFDIRDLRRTENPSFGVKAPEVPNPHYP